MKRIIHCLFVFLVIATVFSCKKDNSNCVEVKYVSGYCPKTGAALLELAKPNSNATSFTDERGNVV
ncbi:hypothetical protein, partial [Arcticibacter eurypsychrophilus]